MHRVMPFLFAGMGHAATREDTAGEREKGVRTAVTGSRGREAEACAGANEVPTYVVSQLAGVEHGAMMKMCHPGRRGGRRKKSGLGENGNGTTREGAARATMQRVSCLLCWCVGFSLERGSWR